MKAFIMRTAKAVEVREVRASFNYDPPYTNLTRRTRAQELLRSYPETTEEETTEIMDFPTRAMHFDVRILAVGRS
jgi:hypothetical protein